MKLPSLLPRSLFGRLILILLSGLMLAQALAFAVAWIERNRATQSMMLSYAARDIAAAARILERTPAVERSAIAALLSRENYRYVLGDFTEKVVPASDLAENMAANVTMLLGEEYRPRAESTLSGKPLLRFRLRDGTPMAVELSSRGLPVAGWAPALLAVQLAVLVLASWLAVRLVVRPLDQLADAARTMVPGPAGSSRESICTEDDVANRSLAEDGPREVAHAAQAFNAMRLRIREFVQERTRTLAAVSHDLQTPLTRMRLRAELMDDEKQRQKWLSDLDLMQSLVQEGLAYARSAHAVTEPVQRIDPDAFMNALVADYLDGGSSVVLQGDIGHAIATRPQALRRLLCNLIDNALKFAGEACVEVQARHGCMNISVMDRGPGIPDGELEAVRQPFYRLEHSRNKETGGTGLGLAIASQLAAALGGTLSLNNRPDGGLQATLAIKAEIAERLPRKSSLR
jgi:signal transduction histidine kinase